MKVHPTEAMFAVLSILAAFCHPAVGVMATLSIGAILFVREYGKREAVEDFSKIEKQISELRSSIENLNARAGFLK